MNFWLVTGFRIAGVCAALLPTIASAEPVDVQVPMRCTRGGDDTVFRATVTLPPSLPSGSTFTVRIDSAPSGRVSHLGLHYIYGMTTQYLLPAGMHYIEGSAQVVPGTGTANVRPGARAWHAASHVFLKLPAHVANGDHYTPPSLQFAVQVEEPAGMHVALAFVRYEVMANAILVGDVRTDCEPVPAPYRLATLRVEPRTLP